MAWRPYRRCSPCLAAVGARLHGQAQGGRRQCGQGGVHPQGVSRRGGSERPGLRGHYVCVDGSGAPLQLPRHLLLTDADLPCAMPTYWTLAPFNHMARVVPEKLTSHVSPDGLDEANRADGADGADRAVVASGTRGAHWCADKREWVMLKDNRKICDKNHNFKILTALSSVEGVRQAAITGASLYLLHVKRARVLVLNITRVLAGGDVRHRARADVKPELLRELEVLLDEAEIEEKLCARAHVTDQ